MTVRSTLIEDGQNGVENRRDCTLLMMSQDKLQSTKVGSPQDKLNSCLAGNFWMLLDNSNRTQAESPPETSLPCINTEVKESKVKRDKIFPMLKTIFLQDRNQEIKDSSSLSTLNLKVIKNDLPEHIRKITIIRYNYK